ncbi:hypothetical protein ACHQM5_021414 [Ranunculus cassubicifolius]
MVDGDSRKIRNICILAHVDHGKTTLADHLIAGSDDRLLNPKQAGSTRFMDYLDEERRRAITMKSSSIGLQYKGYSVNLIDSPGHIDFCSEVSSAARLSDGALVLVDAVEGVRVQTHAVLRQAFVEKLTPCLVINKIDRLIVELKLSPMEAYEQLLRIVHEVNSIMSGYKSEKYLSDINSLLADPVSEMDDEEDTFQPQKGNVAFACAIAGWGFTIREFAEIWAPKLGVSAVVLQKALWGPYYYKVKTKVIAEKKGSKDPPLFVQCVLEQIWKVYQGALGSDGDKGVLNKVVKMFNLSVPAWELQNAVPKLKLQAVMSRWLPLSDSILDMVVYCMPDPIVAQSFRVSRLLPKRDVLDNGVSLDVPAEVNYVRHCVETCNCSSEAPTVAFVSKMFAVPLKDMEDGGGDSDECFLAFARIFSGVLFSGQKIHVLSTLYDPLKGEEEMQKHLQEVELHSLYVMMGQELTPVASAKAGNVVAIRGLGQNILKSATLSSTKNCCPFSSMTFQVAPTLRVAIESSDPTDMGALIKGLRLLNRADPCVEVSVSATGEQLLAAAGEVHLERCITDLRERFARVKIQVSPPLVSYKETIEGNGLKSVDILNVLTGNSECTEKEDPKGRFKVRVHVMKLPPALTNVIEESSDLLGAITEGKLVDDSAIQVLKNRLVDSIESEIEAGMSRNLWLQCLERIWALGSRHIGPNILLVPDDKGKNSNGSFLIRGHSHVSERLGFVDFKKNEDLSETNPLHMEAESLQNSVVSGFQLATAAGPLCEEPMWGLAFLVETFIKPDDTESSNQHNFVTPQITRMVKEACREAMEKKKPRLVEGMYFCELNTPTEHLGPMYAVLSRRRARVVKEELQEGSSLFTVHAYVPVAESFGIAHELRLHTAGSSTALLMFSHWEVFVSKAEEEVEAFGDGSDVSANPAKKLIDAVKRRKGLLQEKVVQHGTKQRTLARKA